MSCERKKKCDKTCLCASNDLTGMDMCSFNYYDNKTPLIKRTMMRAMTVLMNTVTIMILNIELFPFFVIDYMNYMKLVSKTKILPKTTERDNLYLMCTCKVSLFF